MNLSPLNKIIPSFDSPTLQGFDLNDIQEGQRIKGSSRQYVRFYKKPEVEVYATKVRINEKTGTTTVLETSTREVVREMVNIVTPGDKNVVDDVACDFHKREHWSHYKAFRDGKTAPLGMSLDECGFVSPHMATELRYLGCHTVEQLADASELLCNQIANGFELREFARAKCKAKNSNESMVQVNILKVELENERKARAEMAAEFEKLKSMLVGADGTPETPKKLSPKKPKAQNETTI